MKIVVVVVSVDLITVAKVYTVKHVTANHDWQSFHEIYIRKKNLLNARLIKQLKFHDIL